MLVWGSGHHLPRLLATLLAITFSDCALAAEGGGHIPPLVRDVGLSLILSSVLAILFTLVNFPPIAGYILGGILGGPLFLGLVTDPVNIDAIAQLGFVLLLFVIGLELDFKKISKSGRPIVVTGIFQYPLMVVFGFGLSKLLALIGLGAVIGDDLGALYIGLAIACSSTLLVVKLLQESFELDTLCGRVALGLLVFEDLWAIVIIALQPNLNNPDFGLIAASFTGIALLGGLAMVVARFAVPTALRWIAKDPPVVLVAAISWCFAVVFLGSTFDPVTTALFGLNLHLNVGAGMAALIAGATIASLPYATEIVTRVSVVKDFLITLFFVALGLSIPAPSGVNVIVLAVLIAAIALAARQLIVFPLLYFSGLDRRNAEITAVRMAQISEFSLVLVFLGTSTGHVSAELQTAIILAFVITALTTTLAYKAAEPIHTLLSPCLGALGFKAPTEAANDDRRHYRIAFLGFHRVASSLLTELGRRDPDLPGEVLVIDFNVAIHERIERSGAHVKYGDISNTEILHHAGIERVDIILSTVPDDMLRGTTNAKLVAAAREINQRAFIIAVGSNAEDEAHLRQAGADLVYVPHAFTAKALNDAISAALGGSLDQYAAARQARHGGFSGRTEALP